MPANAVRDSIVSTRSSATMTARLRLDCAAGLEQEFELAGQPLGTAREPTALQPGLVSQFPARRNVALEDGVHLGTERTIDRDDVCFGVMQETAPIQVARPDGCPHSIH